MPSLPQTSDRARVIILGNDAQLAARPAVPVQLARACLAYGFAFVAPGSWGDELLAERATRFLASGSPSAALLLHCPLVEATLGSAGLDGLPSCASVSPPVATARYLRAAFSTTPLHITYVGRCAGGVSPEIDEQLSPDTLLARLTEAGCLPMKEPPHFDDVLPPDRRRFASNPGGAPAPAWLATTLPQATIRDVTRETVATVAKYREPNERCLVDLALASGCHCAADPHAMQRLEPPRAAAAVVNLQLVVDLTPPLLTDRHAARTFASGEAGDPVDVDQLELAGSDSGGPIDYWVRPQAGSGPVRELVSIADASRSERGTPESASSAPPRDPSTREPVGEPKIVRSPAPPKDGPRFSSAVVMGGSMVSLLLAPGLHTPAVRHPMPVPPVTSRVRTPATSSDEHREDRQAPPNAESEGYGMAPIAGVAEAATQVTPPPAPSSVRPAQVGRRPVQFESTDATLNDTARLTRRLPGRAHGALITRRRPDALSPPSTSESLLP